MKNPPVTADTGTVAVGGGWDGVGLDLRTVQQ